MWCSKRQAASATVCLKKVVPILLFNQNLDIFNRPSMDEGGYLFIQILLYEEDLLSAIRIVKFFL